MDAESSTTKIDKLNGHNFHAWKQKIIHLLALKDLEDYIDEDPPDHTSPRFATWRKKDKKAQATIGDNCQEQRQNKSSGVKSLRLLNAIVCCSLFAILMVSSWSEQFVAILEFGAQSVFV